MENVVSILERERGSAQVRLDELAGEVRELKQRIREIDEAVTVLSGRAPPERPQRSGGGKLQDMILKCLKAYGKNGASVREIVFALGVEGRETSEPSASSTLSRMKHDGEVENRNGKWFSKEDTPAEVSTADSFTSLVPAESGGPSTQSRRPLVLDDDDLDVPF